MENSLEKIKSGGEKVRAEVRQKSIGYIIGALGLVAGLAWNEAIKALIEYLFPLSQNTIVAKFIYAGVITVVVVIVTIVLMRFLGEFKKEGN